MLLERTIARTHFLLLLEETGVGTTAGLYLLIEAISLIAISHLAGRNSHIVGFFEEYAISGFLIILMGNGQAMHRFVGYYRQENRLLEGKRGLEGCSLVIEQRRNLERD